MKNIILLISIFVFFACGNESPKTATTAEVPTEKTPPTVATGGELASSIDVTDPNKNASEIQQALIEKAKMEKNATGTASNVTEKVKETTAKVIEKAPAVVEKVKEEAPVHERPSLPKTKSPEEIAREQQIAREIAQKAKQEAAAKQAAIEKQKQDLNEMVEIPDFVDEKQPPPPPPPFSHMIFDNLLKKNVSSSGKVNYKGFKNDEKTLNAYLNQLEGTPIGRDWSKNKKMAYWINAYNAYTIKLILKNYPVAKITDLHGGKPWDVKWIKLDGRSLSLNNIENDILRPTYKDARIHFAVNCAAKSCPPLLNQAWTSSNLNSNFEKQAKAFINDSKFNVISGSNAEVSKIFEWYAADFGDLKSYLNKYAKNQIASGTEIKYKEYDWSLNE